MKRWVLNVVDQGVVTKVIQYEVVWYVTDTQNITGDPNTVMAMVIRNENGWLPLQYFPGQAQPEYIYSLARSAFSAWRLFATRPTPVGLAITGFMAIIYFDDFLKKYNTPTVPEGYYDAADVKHEQVLFRRKVSQFAFS
jgi:hypothetical protein